MLALYTVCKYHVRSKLMTHDGINPDLQKPAANNRYGIGIIHLREYLDGTKSDFLESHFCIPLLTITDLFVRNL